MRQFNSIEKLDTAILYILELVSSLSVLLLAFGLIASMANVLTKGSVLTHNDVMQGLYAWTQCIGIDASIPGAIMRTLYFYRQREYLKAGLYTVMSALLLFTAAIVSNIEAVQQTLSLTLDSAYTHVFISVEALIWIRSIAVVLLVVAHAVKHVPDERQQTPINVLQKHTPEQTVNPSQEEPRTLIEEEAQSQEPKQLPSPTNENFERVKAYMSEHPDASARTVGKALGFTGTTANKWMRVLRGLPPDSTSLDEELS